MQSVGKHAATRVICVRGRFLADAKRGKTCNLSKCEKTDTTIAKHDNNNTAKQ